MHRPTAAAPEEAVPTQEPRQATTPQPEVAHAAAKEARADAQTPLHRPLDFPSIRRCKTYAELGVRTATTAAAVTYNHEHDTEAANAPYATAHGVVSTLAA